MSFVIKNIVIMLVASALIVFAIAKIFPANMEFFLSRFEEIKQSPYDKESNTLLYRFERTGEIISSIDADKAIIGMGPVTQAQFPWVEAMKATTADLVWTGVVFRWGFIGLILLAALYIIGCIKSFLLFMKSEGIISQLALLFFLVIISQLIEGFTSWTFMSPSRFALGFWYFGMFSALLGIAKDYQNQEDPEFIDE